MYLTVSIMYQVLSTAYLKRLFSFFTLAACYLLLTTTSAHAQTMSNDNYIIRMQGFNAISGVTAGNDYKVRSTVGDLSPVVSEGVNFKIKAGFENLASTLPFSISLSSDIVDFGLLSPTNPIIRTVDLGMNSLNAYGYSVLVSENEPLTTIPPASAAFIPDTTCDNGQCGTEDASEWINTLTYGFGYRCDNVAGVDCDNSFTKANFYKHFPDITNNDDPQAIMAGIGANNRASRISYKVNVSGNQAQGTYNNLVSFIGVPNF